MKVLVLLVFLSGGCFAQRPQPCSSPSQLTGRFFLSSADEKLSVVGKYSYDALGKRTRLRELASFDNRTFYFDALLMYKEQILYKINNRDQSCTKMRLDGHFNPLVVPRDAIPLGQTVVGSMSQPEQGLLVNNWVGEVQMNNGSGKYMITVTEFGCFPVATRFHTSITGWTMTDFFNNIARIDDPQQLTPPHFCKDVQLEEDENPATLFNVFEKAMVD